VSAARLTVPGNILLLGEYAVLEEGGLGLAMAVETRVRLEASPASSLSVEGRWPGRSISWTPSRRGTSAIVEAAVDTVSEWLGCPLRARVFVDSSALFTPDGRKTGLGSSAAVSVALVCGLLHAAGDTGPRVPDVPGLALKAHRLAQGGRGSGYDVFSSFHGGTGLFRGGASPSWEPRPLPCDLGALLFAGPAPVSTSESVLRYSQWKERNPGPARDFLRESNNSILSFVDSATTEGARKWLGACRRLGIELGRSIGVPAELPIPAGLDPRWCKSLGAGNELGLCLAPRGAQLSTDVPGVRRVLRAEAGAAWEE
jgi:phosphomevalonate kinase